MYANVEAGFAAPQEIIFAATAYFLFLCLPVAITYMATGFEGSLIKQVNVAIAGLIIVVAGCFVFYGPSISYLALALTAISLGVSVHQVINRSTIEKSL